MTTMWPHEKCGFLRAFLGCLIDNTEPRTDLYSPEREGEPPVVSKPWNEMLLLKEGQGFLAPIQALPCWSQETPQRAPLTHIFYLTVLRVQVPKKDLTRLKSKCPQDTFLSEGSRRGSKLVKGIHIKMQSGGF